MSKPIVIIIQIVTRRKHLTSFEKVFLLLLANVAKLFDEKCRQNILSREIKFPSKNMEEKLSKVLC